jgi:sugar phosphate permease
VLGIGLTGCAAFLVAAAYAPSLGWLVAFLALAGAAGASVNSASGRAVMQWFRPSQRGLALGIRQTAIPVGGLVAALTLPHLGFESGLLFLAGFCLLGGLAGVLAVRDPQETELPVEAVEWTLRDRRLWELSFGSGLYLVAQVAIIGFVVLFLHDEHGVSLKSAAAVLAAIQITSAVARIAIGRLSDRRDRRIGPLRGAGIAGAALVALAALLNGAPLGVLIPLLILGGAAMSSWNGLSFTAAAEIAGRARAGTAMSLQNTLVSILGAVASPLFGNLAGATSYGTAYLIIAAAPVAGWWVLRPLEEDEEERAEARAQRLAAYPVKP